MCEVGVEWERPCRWDVVVERACPGIGDGAAVHGSGKVRGGHV